MEKISALEKKKTLMATLKGAKSLLVAFSGGVDSTLLLAAAHDVLGDSVVAATSGSVIHPVYETESAKAFCRERGIRHIIFHSEEMKTEDFLRNDSKRCYYCKKRIMKALFKIASDEGLGQVAHGANVDDLRDYRPGARAAEEAGAIAPLFDAQLNKEEIRFLSKEMGLSTWNRPSMACLASRIPYGERITEKKLKMVEAAEKTLFGLGFKGVRVRHHGSMARIETRGNEIANMIAEGTRGEIVEKFREIGFLHIALDLEGYKSGKMNRELIDRNISV